MLAMLIISSLGYLWCNERALWFELQSELFVDLTFVSNISGDQRKLFVVTKKLLNQTPDTPFEICPEMHALAKMTEMALNCQNRQTVNKNTNEMAKGPFGKVAILVKMAYLAKMAEMAINQQNRQTVNKNTNEMVKGPFGKWRFWRKWQNWCLIAKIVKL